MSVVSSSLPGSENSKLVRRIDWEEPHRAGYYTYASVAGYAVRVGYGHVKIQDELDGPSYQLRPCALQANL